MWRGLLVVLVATATGMPTTTVDPPEEATTVADIDTTTVKLPVLQRRSDDEFALPPPITITSDVLSVKDVPGDKSRKGRRIEVGTDGIQTIVGVRVPDDEEDKVKVWRNARVINGVLVPKKASLTIQSRILHSKGIKFPSSKKEDGFQPMNYQSPEASSSEGYQDVAEEKAGVPANPYGIQPAPSNAFVIQPQTYQAGPGQPVFTVPIPIPKDQHGKTIRFAIQPAPPAQKVTYLLPPYYYAYPSHGPRNRTNIFQKVGEKIRDFTKPVFDPLMEASVKISDNLGISKKIDEVGDKIGKSEAVVPAAVLAGGAALGVGALALSWYLSKMGKFGIQVRSRERRQVPGIDQPIMDNLLESLEHSQRSVLEKLQDMGFGGWREAPCAKRIFCDVMVQQKDDAVMLMEKRMTTFLSMLPRDVSSRLSSLLVDVMEAVRQRDCSSFSCGGGEESGPNLDLDPESILR